MRHILSDHAAKRRTDKRGGGWNRVTLSGDVLPDLSAAQPGVDLIALDDALHELAEADPRGARVVELRFFTGMTFEEVAESIDAYVRTPSALQQRSPRRFNFIQRNMPTWRTQMNSMMPAGTASQPGDFPLPGGDTRYA